MFLGTLIGDAYGMGFEYQTFLPEENNATKFRKHGLYTNLLPGQYTDDTQMTIANAKVILKHKDKLSSLTPLDFANEYVSEFKFNPIFGYAKGLQSVLMEVNSGIELLNKISAFGKTNRNGSLMRCLPFSFLKDKELIISLVGIQGSVTHEGLGVETAKTMALFGKEILEQSKTKEQWFGWLENNFPQFSPWKWDGSPVKGENLSVATMKAAATAFLNSLEGDLTNTLIESVSYTGDTDTVASLACGLREMAFGKFGKEEVVSHKLWDSLWNDNPAFGRDYVREFDRTFQKEMNK